MSTNNTHASQDSTELMQCVCQELAERTATQASDWFVVFKARQGMNVVFKGLRDIYPAQTKVVTQLFTCCTAVDPIMAAGLEPIYGDITTKTLALDVNKLPIGEKTAAVVLQHTFGIQNVELDSALREAAHAYHALFLEDCAHCAGILGRDAFGVPVADVSVHSFGVEKMFPTTFGAAVWVNPQMSDTVLHDYLVQSFSELPELTPQLARAVQRYRSQIRVFNHIPRSLSRSLRSMLAHRGRFEPAIAESEMRGELASEPMVPNAWIMQRVLGALTTADALLAHRREVVSAYAHELDNVVHEPVYDQMWVCPGGLDEPQPLLRLGAFLPDEAAADEAISQLCSQGFYTVPWYRPLLFPGVTDEARYGLPHGIEGAVSELPVTALCSRGAVALPTDIPVEQIPHVIEIVRKAQSVGRA